MKYAKILKFDIINGPGFRTALFTQGCKRHCEGCFNPETWSLDGGKEFTQDIEDQVIELCKNEHCSGLSILGGEPLLPENVEGVSKLIQHFRKECPNKTVWLWTGYQITLAQLTMKQKEVIGLCDIIIDGPFIKERKNTNLYYAGSTNQKMYEVLPNGLLGELKMPMLNDSTSSK